MFLTLFFKELKVVVRSYGPALCCSALYRATDKINLHPDITAHNTRLLTTKLSACNITISSRWTSITKPIP